MTTEGDGWPRFGPYDPASRFAVHRPGEVASPAGPRSGLDGPLRIATGPYGESERAEPGDMTRIRPYARLESRLSRPVSDGHGHAAKVTAPVLLKGKVNEIFGLRS